jgi:hypothetical protein
VDTFELRPPVAPTSLSFDPKLGPDRLLIQWTASTSPDAVRYLVYQSEASGGPYSLVSSDPVAHGVFVDVGLMPGSKYFYVVTALDASGNESARSAEYSGSTNPPQVVGWPIEMALVTVSSPVIGDIDGDGDLEIVQGNDKVYVWHHDGVEFRDGDGNAQTWGVFSTAGDQFVSPIALARMDGKPGLEILAASRNTKQVFLFNYQGNVLPGWPQSVENVIRAGVVAGDIDGDGVLEVIATDELGVLYVWKANGSEYRDGDGNPSTPGVFRRFTGCTYQYSTPAVVDIDQDGLNEIVVGTQGDSLYVLNENGTKPSGWPVYLGGDIAGSPAVGDIDDNGDLEIVANTQGGLIRAYHHTGAVMWSQFFTPGTFLSFGPSPALGDLDGDGKLETAIPSPNRNLYVVRSNGTIKSGWPVAYSSTTYTESSPILTDIDGDGDVDVILGDETSLIHAWDGSGNVVAGFPLATTDAMRATPAADDVDGDGNIDLVAAGWDKTLYVWDFPGDYHADKSPWPRFHANRHNDGYIDSKLPTGVEEGSVAVVVGRDGVELTWTIPAGAGSVFDIDRAEVVGEEANAFQLMASGVVVSGEGVVHYVDREVRMGSHYVYQLVAEEGESVVHTTGVVYVPVTRAGLEQNYPNPFNPRTRIVYYVAEGAAQGVEVVVYDVRGSRVRTLVNGIVAGGRHDVEWDGRDNGGGVVASGVYFCRMVSPGFAETRKMLLLK